ncbi:DNA polymerase III, epsilon subunit [Halomonas shengliensis]|uniref:DNA polymerase III, epsilon subunit n=1 Tax=Halomonas shengliensis TaxID=419597 RepID=A0A1H0LYH2_9GAMM|nr:3'-5' exonuclease [Halomonas shengliensis]SDO73133.1 DNA polymerase III, epsilon subunit [Halomonas shengliensis]
MRIIGGSFGTRGTIKIGSHGVRIKASREALYPPGTVTRVSTRQEKERRFGCLSFLVGLLLFGTLATLLLGPLGLISALVLCIAGSFYGTTRYLVDMVFKDGAHLTLETTRRQADQLVQLQSVRSSPPDTPAPPLASDEPSPEQQRAQEWLADPETVILDTETTGLSENAQVLELAIIDMQGNELLNTLVRPSAPVGAKAREIHGITREHVRDAPTVADLAMHLRAILQDRRVVTYNAEFDERLLRQSLAAHDVEMPRGVTFECAMRTYAEWYSPGGRWQKLGNAARQTGTHVAGTPHRAMTDCQTTLGVIQAMAQWPSHQASPHRNRQPATPTQRPAAVFQEPPREGWPTWAIVLVIVIGVIWLL